MPIPSPRKDEPEQDFMSRCMGHDMMQEYDQEQRAAICYKQWGEPSARRTAALEALHRIRESIK